MKLAALLRELAFSTVYRSFRTMCQTVPMEPQPQQRPGAVIGPLGTPLTLQDLPGPLVRWVPRRKAELVAAVKGGLLTRDEAIERYDLTLQELLSWEGAIDRHGLQGLRVTRAQDYRAADERRRW